MSELANVPGLPHESFFLARSKKVSSSSESELILLARVEDELYMNFRRLQLIFSQKPADHQTSS